ncbi:hypothetical protein Tco_1553914 [Tanacetum coccineum]
MEILVKDMFNAPCPLGLQNDKCQEQLKNDTVCKEKASNVFRKEREQYFEIQDLKAQLQDKHIAISELKKLIENCKGKSVETQFNKPSIVRQPNAKRIPKPSVLGKPTPFSNSPEMRSFQTKQSVNKTNVSDGLFKQVTQQNLPQIRKQAVRNTNLIAPGPSRNCPKHVLHQSPREKVGSNDMVKQTGKFSRLFVLVVPTESYRNSAKRARYVLQWCNEKQQRIDITADALYNEKQENLRVWLLKFLISKKPAPFLNVQMMSVHISSGLVLHQMTSDHNRSETLKFKTHKEPSSSKLVPKVVPLAVKTATSRQELELLFHHHIAKLRTTAFKIMQKYEHVGQKTQDRKEWQKDVKDNDKGSKSRSQSMKEQDYNEDKDQEHSSLNDKSNLTDLMKEYDRICTVKFNSIKDAKKLLEAVEKRFGGNAAKRKTQMNLLKQQYAQLNEKLSQEDVNQKLLRSLLPELNTHAVMWRNKADLDTMSMDDLYNNLKVYETRRNFIPPTPDLSFIGLYEFVNKPVVEKCKVMSSKEEPKVVRKNDDAPCIVKHMLLLEDMLLLEGTPKEGKS